MKYNGTTLICTTVLTILLGISIQSQNVQADTTDTVVKTEQASVANTSKDTSVITPQSNQNDQKSKVADFPLTVDANTQQTSVEGPGGDWDVNVKDATPQNNFFYYENKDYIENSANKGISASPTDMTGMDALTDSNQKIQDDIKNDLTNIADGSESADAIQTKQAADYYQLYMDSAQSDDVNIDSLKSEIQKINNLKSYQYFAGQIGNLTSDGMVLPFNISWKNDSSNVNQHIVTFDQAQAPTYQLPSLDFDDNSMIGRAYYFAGMSELMNQLGYSDDQAKEILTKALTYNQLLVKNFSNEQTVDFGMELDKNPQIMPLDSFYNQTGGLDLSEYISSTYPTAKNIQIIDSKYFKTLNSALSRSNFEGMKDWMIAINVLNLYYAFGKQGTEAMSDFLQVDPTDSDNSLSQDALTNTEAFFQDALSTFYGKKYMSEATESKVTSIVNNIIDAYETRLSNNTWLSPEGKKNILAKLENINVNVGYPKVIPESGDYSSLDIADMKNIFDVETVINNYSYDQYIQAFTKPNDRNTWPGPSFTMNAEYDPSSNAFVIFDGILHSPLYSDDYTDSQNYGGIGIVIGHEISHAFDNNGSLYDKDGNYRKILSDQDRATFIKMSDKMVEEYNGISLYGNKVDGTLTLGENMADNGGTNISLQVAKTLPNFNAQGFFATWAKGWACTMDPMYISMLFGNEHTPNPIRTNVSVQNIDDFYTAFDIKPGDPMWLDPSQRVNIW